MYHKFWPDRIRNCCKVKIYHYRIPPVVAPWEDFNVVTSFSISIANGIFSKIKKKLKLICASPMIYFEQK